MKLPGEPRPPEQQNPQATHRLAVIQISRILNHPGKLRVTPLWRGDFNLMRLGVDQHRYAIVISRYAGKTVAGCTG